jgi:hypothetical protein
MADSGIPWIDVVFDWSVLALVWIADSLDITYEEINVWLFVIIWPLVTLAMAVVIVLLWRNNVVLRGQVTRLMLQTN